MLPEIIVAGVLPKTLNLFMAKICDFHPEKVASSKQINAVQARVLRPYPTSTYNQNGQNRYPIYRTTRININPQIIIVIDYNRVIIIR